MKNNKYFKTSSHEKIINILKQVVIKYKKHFKTSSHEKIINNLKQVVI